jgi:hypothetical protein
MSQSRKQKSHLQRTVYNSCFEFIILIWGLGTCLFITTSTTALEPTQPPIQWVQGALSLGVKRPGREADHTPPSSAEVKECVELYFYSPNTSLWRGAQLKSTGTTSLLLYLYFDMSPIFISAYIRPVIQQLSHVSWVNTGTASDIIPFNII